MKRYRENISLLLVVVLLVSIVTIPVNAISEPTITVCSAEDSAGNTVNIDIGILNNLALFVLS